MIDLANISSKYIFFYLSLILVNILILLFIPKLSKKFNFYDFPNERKLHFNPTSYLGGIFFFISNFFYIFFFQNNFFESHNLLLNWSNIFSLIFISSFIFLLGLLDDKYDIPALKKSVILIILISSAVLIDEKVLIKTLNFEIFEKTLTLKNFSLFFTILCIYLFINACNMYDGADLQLGTYFLIILFYLYFKTGYFHILSPILIPLIFFLFKNFKQASFLGNNGSHFLSYIIAIIIIKFYNSKFFISTEEIIIIMLVPGLDCARLFFYRISKNKKFFESDLNHIHHILGKKYKKYNVQFIIILLTISPIIIGELFNSYFLGIISGTIFYFLSIIKKIY